MGETIELIGGGEPERTRELDELLAVLGDNPYRAELRRNLGVANPNFELLLGDLRRRLNNAVSPTERGEVEQAITWLNTYVEIYESPSLNQPVAPDLQRSYEALHTLFCGRAEQGSELAKLLDTELVRLVQLGEECDAVRVSLVSFAMQWLQQHDQGRPHERGKTMQVVARTIKLINHHLDPDWG